MSLQKYSLDLVIANLLATYIDKCTIYSARTPNDSGTLLTRTSDAVTAQPLTSSLEALIISHVLAAAEASSSIP